MRIPSSIEVIEARRKRRARAMVEYSVLDGVPREEAEKIAKAYLERRISYGEALEMINKLVKKHKKHRHRTRKTR